MPTITTQQDPTTAPPADVTARYMARLEEHLAGVPPIQRLATLAHLKTWWIEEFERWALRVDQGVATATDLKCNAFDFRMTIDAVSARHAQEAAHGRA